MGSGAGSGTTPAGDGTEGKVQGQGGVLRGAERGAPIWVAFGQWRPRPVGQSRYMFTTHDWNMKFSRFLPPTASAEKKGADSSTGELTGGGP